MQKATALSIGLHVAVLLWATLSYSGRAVEAPPTEALPVEFISEKDFSQMTKGIKEAPKKEKPKPLVEKKAEPKPVEQPKAKVEKKEVKAAVDKTPEPPPEPKVKPPEEKKEAKAEPKPQPKIDPIADKLKQESAKKNLAKIAPQLPPRRPPRAAAQGPEIRRRQDRRAAQQARADAHARHRRRSQHSRRARHRHGPRRAALAVGARRPARAADGLVESAGRHQGPGRIRHPHPHPSRPRRPADRAAASDDQRPRPVCTTRRATARCGRCFAASLSICSSPSITPSGRILKSPSIRATCSAAEPRHL